MSLRHFQDHEHCPKHTFSPSWVPIGCLLKRIISGSNKILHIIPNSYPRRRKGYFIPVEPIMVFIHRFIGEAIPDVKIVGTL